MEHRSIFGLTLGYQMASLEDQLPYVAKHFCAGSELIDPECGNWDRQLIEYFLGGRCDLHFACPG